MQDKVENGLIFSYVTRKRDLETKKTSLDIEPIQAYPVIVGASIGQYIRRGLFQQLLNNT